MHKEHQNKLMVEEEKKKKYEDKLKSMEKELIETRTYTPVTRENFEVWFKKFYSEQMKGKEKKIEQEQRQTGREIFMNMKNLKSGEGLTEADEGDTEDREEETTKVENEDQKENPIVFDAEAFEENIDDIDFDQEFVDDI